MRLGFLLLLLVASLSAWPVTATDAELSDRSGSDVTVVESEDVVEKNPYYIDSSKKKRANARRKVDEVLSKSRRKREPQSNVGKRVKRAAKYLKRHRVQLLVAVAIYAFRKEVGVLIWQMLSTPVYDPAKKLTTRRIDVTKTLTAGLKIYIFVFLMRQLQNQTGEEGSSSVMDLLLLALGGRNPIIPLFLTRLRSSTCAPVIQQHFVFERLNDRYEKDGLALQKAIDPQQIKYRPWSPSQQKKDVAILMDLTGLDTSLSQLDTLRDSVSFLVSQHGIPSVSSNSSTMPNTSHGDFNLNQQVEVIVLLESPGGQPSNYALASQQMLRLRKQGIKVTICVDKVAASGGYMIACTSSPGRLFVAPFSTVGSIGVVGHLVNVHKRLQSWNIEALTFRSGKDKAPLSRLSEVTEAGISAVQNDVDNLQRTFKRHVVESRPILRDVIDHIATGETWLGHDALHQGLVDRVITSDEYISERLLDGATVLKLSRRVASKYPFLPSSPVSAVQASSSPLSSLFPKLQKLLDQSSALLGRFLGDCDSLHAGYMSVKCAGHELTCG